jgi:hypothetical protein
MIKQAVLTKPFKIGISSRAVLKAGTQVEIEQKGENYLLHRRNFRGKIEADAFRWCQHQQASLFGG